MVLERRQTANMQQSKTFFGLRDSSDIGGLSAVIDVNNLVSGRKWDSKQVRLRALADSDDPIAPS
jgi:hypothetical protein